MTWDVLIAVDPNLFFIFFNAVNLVLPTNVYQFFNDK